MRPHKARKKHARGSTQKEYPFYPNQLLRVLIVIMGTVAVVAMLSALFPPALHRIADPLTGPDAGTQVLWMLKPAILLGDLVARPGLTIVLIAFLAALFVFLPALDRRPRTIKQQLLVATPFLLWILFLAISTLLSIGVPG